MAADVWTKTVYGSKPKIGHKQYTVNFEFLDTPYQSHLSLTVSCDERKWTQTRGFYFVPFIPHSWMEPRYNAQVDEFYSWMVANIQAIDFEDKLDAWTRANTPNPTNCYLKQPRSVFGIVLDPDQRHTVALVLDSQSIKQSSSSQSS
jgi:hypothetical protein